MPSKNAFDKETAFLVFCIISAKKRNVAVTSNIIPTRIKFCANKVSTCSWKKSPTNAAGIAEIIILSANCLFSLCFKEKTPIRISLISFLKTKIVLNAVPKWRTRVMNKLSWPIKSLPKNILPISKCPLEDIGKNSVSPWIMPRKIASKLFIFLIVDL